MQRHATSLLALLFALCVSAASAANPSFTISATNVTMSTSDANIPVTLTSLNGYAGTVTVSCAPPSVPADVYLPYCGGPVAGLSFNLKANATLTEPESLHTQAYPDARLLLHGQEARAAWAFAGVLLLGFGFRRRRMRWLSILLLSAGALIGFTGLTACGGGGNNPNFLTPGTYPFTLNAADSNNMTASTTVRVTILTGIAR
ncbi:MAG TPA: hypothetical protein VMD92_05715 [Acidobacteriaceae bacterium]|jgi:hypothetical protein|nr:hypothetical protein [Acidobacteriaceae bacterium]